MGFVVSVAQNVGSWLELADLASTSLAACDSCLSDFTSCFVLFGFSSFSLQKFAALVSTRFFFFLCVSQSRKSSRCSLSMFALPCLNIRCGSRFLAANNN